MVSQLVSNKENDIGNGPTGVDVVVATPGRLLHLNEEKILLLDRVSYLVVDEADRFMHGSMEEELRKVSPGNKTLGLSFICHFP